MTILEKTVSAETSTKPGLEDLLKVNTTTAKATSILIMVKGIILLEVSFV